MAVSCNMRGAGQRSAPSKKDLLCKLCYGSPVLLMQETFGGAASAEEMEELMRKRLGLAGSRFRVISSEKDPEKYKYAGQGVMIIINLDLLSASLGHPVTAEDIEVLRIEEKMDSKPQALDLGGTLSKDCPKFVGAVLNIGGQQLVVGSLYRPPRSGEKARQQFAFMDELMALIHEQHPGALFIIGGDFNIEPHKRTLEQEVLNAFGKRWDFQFATPNTPTTKPRGDGTECKCFDYYVVSKELFNPSSMCSVLKESAGSDHYAVQGTFQLPLKWLAEQFIGVLAETWASK
jgi:exonuclease III